jgi:hypothetical protein
MRITRIADHTFVRLFRIHKEDSAGPNLVLGTSATERYRAGFD